MLGVSVFYVFCAAAVVLSPFMVLFVIGLHIVCYLGKYSGAEERNDRGGDSELVNDEIRLIRH